MFRLPTMRSIREVHDIQYIVQLLDQQKWWSRISRSKTYLVAGFQKMSRWKFVHYTTARSTDKLDVQWVNCIAPNCLEGVWSGLYTWVQNWSREQVHRHWWWPSVVLEAKTFWRVGLAGKWKIICTDLRDAAQVVRVSLLVGDYDRRVKRTQTSSTSPRRRSCSTVL